jgi:hypothetical protein
MQHVNILRFIARSSLSSLYFHVPHELLVHVASHLHMPHPPHSPLSDNPQSVRSEFEGQGIDGRTGPVVSSREQSNQPQGSTKCQEFLD